MKTAWGLSIICCPLCGMPLYRSDGVGRPPLEIYLPRQGFEFVWKHFPAGRGANAYCEKLVFADDVCANCAGKLATLFEPAIRHIKDYRGNRDDRTPNR